MRSVETLYDTQSVEDLYDAFPGGTRTAETLASRPRGRIVLERPDITFFKHSPDRLRVEITLRNASREASLPTVARVRAAPFGAFVSWTPLLRLPVPALPPGEATTLRADTLPPFPSALSGPNRVLEWLLRATGRSVLRGEHDVHWAGNIDVLVRGLSVERHVASGLRLSPGATNMADFIVGDRDDDYMFQVTGDVAGWDIGLYRSLFSRNGSIPADSWVPLRARRALFMVAKPPQRCTGGHVNVHVRQRSTARDAVVEFGFQT